MLQISTVVFLDVEQVKENEVFTVSLTYVETTVKTVLFVAGKTFSRVLSSRFVHSRKKISPERFRNQTKSILDMTFVLKQIQ